MTILLLVRHGHVDGIKPPRFRGRADLALTETGQRQAELLAHRIASQWTPGSIHTSPLQRCIATGAAVARVCGVPSEPLTGLNDLDYGRWQSLTFDDARAENPDSFAAWLATPHLVEFPGGESLQDVAARTASVLRFVRSRNAADTLVLVGHDSVNRVMLTQILDMPLSAYWRIVQSPCCLNEIEITGSSFQLRRMNDTAHLDSGID
ncbi:histidine phosphatase family protein [Bradyrhizobium sp.]|jgi:probable phosphoglycerate mutase|uniref:histidine phosphatase family protein n=1 Tax=Bradyrhizobium sp. TaxID=376 RepID=UPI003D0D81FC